MAENKTQPTDASVSDFITSVAHATRRADAEALDSLFRDITGWQPQMWGDTLIGYGRYDYRYKSGREGSFLATGFSPRKAALSIYIMPGYRDYAGMLARLGKHKTGAACLYVTKLADVDMDVLEEMIRAGLDDLAKIHPVYPS